MQLVTDNPNPLAITFNNMEGINMKDFRKVVVPSKDHGIAEHVPMAKILLEQNDAFDRVEFSNMNGNVSMTLCLAPGVTKGNPDFQLPEATKHQIVSLVSQIQKHIKDTGQNPVHTCKTIRNYGVAKAIKSEALQGDVRSAFNATISIINPMAAKHGGSFEVVDIYDASEHTLTDNEKTFLNPQKQSIGFDLVVFGSCSGCASFNFTYGQTPRKIAPVLKEMAPNNGMQVRQITPSEKYAAGQVLIFT